MAGLTDRERDVLASLTPSTTSMGRASAVARVLNLNRPCQWCPVGPPRDGEVCASVPRASREAVERVLVKLERKGLVVRRWPGTRMMFRVAITDPPTESGRASICN